MNYFYAQVEERDNPTLKTVPVVVGGKPDERGSIVATCNYEARSYGIHAGMSSGDSKEYSRLLSQLRISNFRNKSTLNSKLLRVSKCL